MDAISGKIPFQQFLLLASVKWVIKLKGNFTKTNKKALIRGMYGKPVNMTRYKFDKLILGAFNRGLFTKIPAGRGYYVSIRYNVEELTAHIKEKVEKKMEKENAAKMAGREIREFLKKKKDDLKRG